MTNDETMDTDYDFNTINAATFDSLLEQYPNILPSKLHDLEQQRLHTVPASVHSRSPSYFTRDELVTLMDWKLAHGKFRPNLARLIKENDDSSVREGTKVALQHVANAKSADGVDVKPCLNELCKFRGVGPATASLLMSVYESDRFPFFSDELYLWAEGWERKIDYNAKAYLSLYTKVQDFRERFSNAYGALDVEKVAYVLGKRRLNDVGDVTKPAVSKKRKAVTTSNASEAKAQDAGSATQPKHVKANSNEGEESTGLRRSSRRKLAYG